MGNNEDLKRADKRNFKVDELKTRVDTYKYYLNMAFQVNGFFYVTTAAVLGFYLKEPNEQSANNHLEFLLLLPILMGSVLGGIFIYAAYLQKESSSVIKEIMKELNGEHGFGLDIKQIPDINLLHRLLLIFGGILFLVSASLIHVPRIGSASHQDDINHFTAVANIVFRLGLILMLCVVYIKTRRIRKRQ